MQIASLVRWSATWLAGCREEREDRAEYYKNQLGVLIKMVDDPPNCWLVHWSNGDYGYVHREYLEVVCK
jgi:hypothetical protein